jgi:hypothetical protein
MQFLDDCLIRFASLCVDHGPICHQKEPVPFNDLGLASRKVCLNTNYLCLEPGHNKDTL